MHVRQKELTYRPAVEHSNSNRMKVAKRVTKAQPKPELPKASKPQPQPKASSLQTDHDGEPRQTSPQHFLQQDLKPAVMTVMTTVMTTMTGEPHGAANLTHLL